MALDFDQYAAKGNLFLKELAKDLGWPKDRDRAARLLRATLHAMRDQLTAEESLQFIAQMPMFLKAVYVDGWTMREKEPMRHAGAFLERVRELDPAGFHDLPALDRSEYLVGLVFMRLRECVSVGEWDDIVSQMPKEMKALATTSVPSL